MKTSDYLPRATHFDTLLKGSNLVGVEVGVDVGAHAEAILLVADIKTLHLVDIWDKDFYFGYCKGRLNSKGWLHKLNYLKLDAVKAASQFDNASLDFIYLDIGQDYDLHISSFVAWVSKLREGGILGIRNAFVPAVNKAIKECIDTGAVNLLDESYYHNEIILIKTK